MSEFIELGKGDLDITWDSLPKFHNTSEVSCYKELIGQERAAEAIDLGLIIDKGGYNIYISGNSGMGKRSYAIKRIMEFAEKKSTAWDWSYVYNFNDLNKPIALRLKPGTAQEFKMDVEGFVEELFDEVPRFFSNDEYQKEKNMLVEAYQKEILGIADKLYEEAKNKCFNVKSTGEGFAFIPIKDGTEMSEREYSQITEEERSIINVNVTNLKLTAYDVIKQTKIIKKNMVASLRELEDRTSGKIVDSKIRDLVNKYGYDKKIFDYLIDLRDDIIENISAFFEEEDENKGYDENFFKRYYINVMVCNKDVSGAPVVYEDTPEYHNLLGIIEYENKSGNLVTDFTMIQPGSLHRANGGYLIIDALQLMGSYKGWEALKRCLRGESITIENLKNQFDIIPMVTLKPEEIPLKVKIVLLGNPYIFHVLYKYDEDFHELFKIRADFEDEIKNIDGTALKILGFISNYCREKGILPISCDGVLEIFKYSTRLTESRQYFTASMHSIVEMIDQAYAIAEANEKDMIGRKDIKAAIAARERRHGLYRDKILEMYKERKYIVDLKGYKIGEINGLSVLDFGDVSFGKVSRITAATFAGRDGIINIERETNMSGDIHSKGVMILSGYIGETFGQTMPISFSASICFEQLYGEVDGDSASAAELVALMSSLGDIPIKQSIAITGSVNQRGEIQPIGGVNEKIEGFFDICSLFGLDGSQGVVIPHSNIDELILKDEVISAVERGLFHIYAVKSIGDCIEILCRLKENTHGKKQIFDVLKDNINVKLNRYRNSFYEKYRK